MNERVLEAAFLAGFINKRVMDDSYFVNDPKLMTKLNKFAEFIVRECANAIQEEKDTGLYNAQQMAGMTVSKTVIKDHFDVE